MPFILLFASLAYAQDALSFAPWSGASFDVTQDGGAITAALATPLPAKKSTGSLDVRGSIPWTGSGVGFGDYTVHLEAHFSNEHQLVRDLVGNPVLEALDSEICALAKIIGSDSQDLGTLAHAYEDGVAEKHDAWLAATRDPKVVTGCRDVGASERARARVARVLGRFATYVERGTLAESESAGVADSAGSTPYDDLAQRKFTIAHWSLAPVTDLAWTTTEAGAGPVAAEAGLSGALYTPKGLVATIAGGPSYDGTAIAGWAEAHLAYVGPAFSGRGLATGQRDEESDKGTYLVAELAWAQEFSTGFAGNGRALVGVRPVGGGAGVMAGITVPASASGFSAPLGTLAISGEIPDLGTR